MAVKKASNLNHVYSQIPLVTSGHSAYTKPEPQHSLITTPVILGHPQFLFLTLKSRSAKQIVVGTL